MPSEPVWLSVGDLVEFNRRLVAHTGEPHQVLNLDSLDGACQRPQWLWHYDGIDDIAVLAVRFMLAVAASHAFLQGNKRTGFVAASVFLKANGWQLDASLDSMELADAMVDVLCDRTSEEALYDWLSDYIGPA